MTGAALTSVLRLADSAFPSGAFSHSFGLETAIADGRVLTEAELFGWIDAYLVDAWATLDGAALVFAMRDAVDVRALDAIVTAATNAPEMRAANARMTGAAFDTFAAMGCDDARLGAYREHVRAGRAAGVPTLAFALVYSALGVPWRDAFAACASALLGGLAAVGTRAIPLGQRATARVLWTLRASVERARAEAESIETPDDLCAQAVAQELDALRHRLLDGRMFAS